MVICEIKERREKNQSHGGSSYTVFFFILYTRTCLLGAWAHTGRSRAAEADKEVRQDMDWDPGDGNGDGDGRPALDLDVFGTDNHLMFEV